MSGFADLPVESVLAIAGEFDRVEDLASLGHTCRNVHHIVEKELITNFPRHALYRGARDGDLELVKRALESGADVNTRFVSSRRKGRFYDDWLPIHAAIDGGHKEIVTLLLEKGADVNGVWYRRQASKIEDLPAVHMLLSLGADINWQSQHGRRVLALACSTGNFEVALALIRAGASL
ncbi:ankyrin repeat-containing domain protein, partial [Lasiosphaeria ovina]